MDNFPHVSQQSQGRQISDDSGGLTPTLIAFSNSSSGYAGSPTVSSALRFASLTMPDAPLEEATSQDMLIAPLSWAKRLKRVFNIDITLCPLYGGAMRVIADITDPDVIQKVLDHIEAQPPPIKPAPAIQP